MSRIDELIKEKCPDGVEYKPLSEVTNLTAGDRIRKSMMSDEAEYPVMGGGNKPTGRYNKCNFKHSATISRAGSAGSVNWLNGKFWATDVCFIASQKDDGPDVKFVYYYLCSQEPVLKTKIYGGNLPKLNKQFLWELPIPLPPIEIQQEIVRMLDSFTELEAELEAELTKRKQQYEHYRDQLLSFENIASEGGQVEWLPLDEVFNLKNGYTPSKRNSEFWNNGTIPWFRMEDIREHGRILSDSIQHVTPEAIKGKLFPAGSIIIATTATIGEHAMLTADSLANQRFTFLTKRKLLADKLLDKYIFYYCFKLGEWCKNHTNISGFASVDMSKFKKYNFPIPPLDVQERIVYVLDNFDAVCNDLNIGLPAEIEARHKQYEYYRDKILTFKENTNAKTN